MCYDFPYRWDLRNDTNEFTYKTEKDSDLENNLMVAGGKDGEERIVGEFGIDRYTLLYLKWIANRDLLCSTWNSAQCCVATWMVGEFGGEWIHVYVWLGPFTVHLKLSQHC